MSWKLSQNVGLGVLVVMTVVTTAMAVKCPCTGVCNGVSVPPDEIECPTGSTCGCLVDCTAKPPTATASCETTP